jgi:hypothetical protein
MTSETDGSRGATAVSIALAAGVPTTFGRTPRAFAVRPDGSDWQGNEDGVQLLLGKLARLTRQGGCPTIPAWTAAASW